jgi:hypothetical protein
MISEFFTALNLAAVSTTIAAAPFLVICLLFA